jgi:hypothetical protein
MSVAPTGAANEESNPLRRSGREEGVWIRLGDRIVSDEDEDEDEDEKLIKEMLRRIEGELESVERVSVK